MRRMLQILIPSCTDEYLGNCLDSMEISEPGSSRLTIVADNGLSDRFRNSWPGVRFLPLAKPFVFARAINLCASESNPDTDLLVLNDDTEIITPDWITAIEDLLEKKEAEPYGLLSFTITGGVGNPEQRVKPDRSERITEASKSIKFVAAVIRRKVWEKVGPLDERFVDYGFDDDDYSLRVRLAGWKIGVTSAVVVKHGASGFANSSTYILMNGREELMRKMEANQRLFMEKWGKESPGGGWMRG